MWQEQLVKRLKSFAWRFVCVALVAGLSWTSQNLGLLELPVWLQGVLGLGLGEVIKWLNSNQKLFGNSKWL